MGDHCKIEKIFNNFRFLLILLMLIKCLNNLIVKKMFKKVLVAF